MNKILIAVILNALLFDANAAESPSIDGSLTEYRIQNAYVSPDGRYLGVLVIKNKSRFFVITDRQKSGPGQSVVNVAQVDQLNWCAWAKPTRVICSIYKIVKFNNEKFNQWIAIDTDGGSVKEVLGGGKPTEHVIDWLRDDPENILVHMDADTYFVSKNGMTGVTPAPFYKRNIYATKIGSLKKVEDAPSNNASQFATDGKGCVRLAEVQTVKFLPSHTFERHWEKLYVRPNGSEKWKVVNYSPESPEPHNLDLVTVITDTDDGFAIGDYKNRQSLWQIDLTAMTPPKLFFVQPHANVITALVGPDRQLLGVEYYSDKLIDKYFDPVAQQLQEYADEKLPQFNNHLVDFSRDMKTAIVRSQSVNEPAKFYVLDASIQPAHLTPINSTFSALENAK